MSVKNKYLKTCPGKAEKSAYINRGGFSSFQKTPSELWFYSLERVIGHVKINIGKNVPERLKAHTSK
jgi:hypothetical protein